MGTIIFLAGLACAIWCVLDILKQPVGTMGKLIVAIAVLATNWVGIALYYFWIRHNMTSWFK